MLARFTPRYALFAGLIAVFATGCAGDERELAPLEPAVVGPIGGETDGAGGGGTDVAVGGCDEGTVRSCKVQINENNCFIGEQLCEFGEWSECLDEEDIAAMAAEAEDEEEDEG